MIIYYYYYYFFCSLHGHKPVSKGKAIAQMVTHELCLKCYLCYFLTQGQNPSFCSQDSRSLIKMFKVVIYVCVMRLWVVIFFFVFFTYFSFPWFYFKNSMLKQRQENNVYSSANRSACPDLRCPSDCDPAVQGTCPSPFP